MRRFCDWATNPSTPPYAIALVAGCAAGVAMFLFSFAVYLLAVLVWAFVL